MTRAPVRLPRQQVRVEGTEPPPSRPRLIRRKRPSFKAAIQKKLAKWLKEKPKRASYLTGVLHGVISTFLVFVMLMTASLLSTIALALVVAAMAFIVIRR